LAKKGCWLAISQCRLKVIIFSRHWLASENQPCKPYANTTFNPRIKYEKKLKLKNMILVLCIQWEEHRLERIIFGQNDII
jgi:hypothetical protein